MKQLNVAILGQGRSGRDIHGASLRQMRELYRIAAVVDPLAHRRQRAAREYGCDTYESHTELKCRSDIDLVVNATPSHLHVPITMELLGWGFNVLCEKPLARKAEEVERLIEAAGRAGKTLAIFQQSRYAPYFEQVKKVIDSGELGRIVQISIDFSGFARRWDWQCLQACNGGSLLNTGPHPLDQALQLLGEGEQPSVTCMMDRANTFGDAEDYVKLILRAPGRPVIDLTISSCCAYPRFTYHVHGTCGGLIGTTDHIDWKFFVPAKAPERALVRASLEKEDGTPAYCTEQLQWHEKSWDVPADSTDLFAAMSGRYYTMLHSAIAQGAPLEITPQQVLRQIAVIEECHRQNPLPPMG